MANVLKKEIYHFYNHIWLQKRWLIAYAILLILWQIL